MAQLLNFGTLLIRQNAAYCGGWGFARRPCPSAEFTSHGDGPLHGRWGLADDYTAISKSTRGHRGLIQDLWWKFPLSVPIHSRCLFQFDYSQDAPYNKWAALPTAVSPQPQSSCHESICFCPFPSPPTWTNGHPLSPGLLRGILASLPMSTLVPHDPSPWPRVAFSNYKSGHGTNTSQPSISPTCPEASQCS